jgi:1,4-dihydroxy-2-naphthoate octaprenyltransferase
VKTAALPLEPRLEALQNPLQRYLLATRPAFLSITVVGILLGFALTPSINLLLATATLLLALLAHAGINVLNDYYDEQNGTDRANQERLFPFTGGSRFIQNGVLSASQMLAWGLVLFAVVIAGGLWLIKDCGPQLFWVGLAGLLIGWAYSAPPLKLNSRGMGELCVFAGFMLIVLGTVIVQGSALTPAVLWAGAPYALLVTNVLYMNQFPDRSADLACGKRHWVARLPAQQAAYGYPLIVALTALAIAIPVWQGVLPTLTLLALPTLLPAVAASRALLRDATTPRLLTPAIKQTLATAHLVPLIMALCLTLAA